MRRRGSLTVFAALSLMLVAQLLFTLLEVSRYRESAKVLQMCTDRELESQFADYCSPLWDTYHILGMSATDGEGNLSFREREAAISEESSESIAGIDLLSAAVEEAEFSDYLLLTDAGGKVFQEIVCEYMKQNIGYEAAKKIYNTYNSAKDGGSSDSDSEDALQKAQDALAETAVPTKSIKQKASSVSEATSSESVENPITAVTEAKKKGVLSLVLKDGTNISTKSLTLSDTVSHRTLTGGTKSYVGQSDWYQNVLFEQYLETYLSCYTDVGEDRGLNYELEYLIGGKSSDEDNLKAAVKELLALRESLNMASIMASSSRQAEALALATAIAGVTVNPAIIEAVKYGIIAAWAFVESVMDIRTLLSGGKISLVKTDADWTSNVNNMPSILSGWSEAKSIENGFNYRQYLGMLLLFHSGDSIALRTMDVQEAAVRLEEGYETFKMDNVVCETQLDITFDYKPIFMGFVYLIDSTPDIFRLERTSSYSYRSQKEGL